MEEDKLEQREEIVLSSTANNQLQENQPQSDIEIYKSVLGEKFSLSGTISEYERLIEVRQKVQSLDLEARRLEYAEEAAKEQLQEAKREANFRRIQQNVATVASSGVGLYLLLSQSFIPAGLLFLILGLAKPLGYSLSEISGLLSGLKGILGDSDGFLSDEKQMTEEGKDSQ